MISFGIREEGRDGARSFAYHREPNLIHDLSLREPPDMQSCQREEVSIDEALQKTGEFGAGQRFVCLLVSLHICKVSIGSDSASVTDIVARSVEVF